MRIRFGDVIHESEEELAAWERRLEGRRGSARVRMLRMLKAGEAPSLRAYAANTGASVTQVNRWWRQYQQGGLEGLTAVAPRRGKPALVGPEVWAALLGEVEVGRIKRLEDARHYLEAQWSVAYRGPSGVWALFKRHGVSLKAGRDAAR
jgi:transposase